MWEATISFKLQAYISLNINEIMQHTALQHLAVWLRSLEIKYCFRIQQEKMMS